ncbi:unnamed protein product [marine sediment metagenome]|uniref:Uncharacterized protein n=1 Tax=marine sediment metagenome TaxID=412755 RepID=X1TND5_9ZZZZ
MKEKTLDTSGQNPARKAVSDMKVIGNTDNFKLLFKASSENEGWMKSTKAMQVDGVGCLIQITTQQKNVDGTYSLAEALVFMPNTRIVEDENSGRKLESILYGRIETTLDGVNDQA